MTKVEALRLKHGDIVIDDDEAERGSAAYLYEVLSVTPRGGIRCVRRRDLYGRDTRIVDPNWSGGETWKCYSHVQK